MAYQRSKGNCGTVEEGRTEEQEKWSGKVCVGKHRILGEQITVDKRGGERVKCGTGKMFAEGDRREIEKPWGTWEWSGKWGKR